MSGKIGKASQVINFNFVHEFVSENLNKLIYSTFTPGVLEFTYVITPTTIQVTKFSGLILPYDKEFLVKADTMSTWTLNIIFEKAPYLIARMIWEEPVNGYDYDLDSAIQLLLVAEGEVDPDFDILLGVIQFTAHVPTSVDVSGQTKVYLNNNCINYDLLQRTGVRTLDGTNPNHIDYVDENGAITSLSVGNNSGNVPLTNETLNDNLNAEYLHGISVGNLDNNIGLKNNILSKNMIGARLYLNSNEYGIGQSGLLSYSGFSGYNVSGWSGASGWVGMSGYIPISNAVVQSSLNAELFGGYESTDFSLLGHTHSLDEIADSTIFKRISNVDTDGLITTNGMDSDIFDYRHQSMTNPFRYDEGNEAKIFTLIGEIGSGGSTSVTFRKTFATPPKVFLLNNETDEWKSVDEDDISETGFIVHHSENTSGTSLVSDTTAFSTGWMAVGELV